MRIKDAKQRIISVAVIFLILLAILGGATLYKISIKNSTDSKISEIRRQAGESLQKASEYESQVSETKKYRKIWITVPEKKKDVNGINVDQIDQVLKALSSKYNISSLDRQIAIPQKLQNGVFSTKTIDVMYATSSITFKSLDDVRAFNFLADFFSSMVGYIIVTNLEMTKTKEYSNQDLIYISGGRLNNAIDVKVSFAWYFYRQRESALDKQSNATE